MNANVKKAIESLTAASRSLRAAAQELVAGDGPVEEGQRALNDVKAIDEVRGRLDAMQKRLTPKQPETTAPPVQ